MEADLIYQISENIQIAQDVYSLTIKAPKLAKLSAPGQFFNVRIPFDDSKLLRRPISICDNDGENIGMSFQIKGEGTKLLALMRPGEKLDLIGPLGNGFPLFKNRRAALIGGGIGVFPLIYLNKVLEKDCDTDIYLGYRNRECIYMADDFSGNNICISTEDGSTDNKGYITDFFEKEVKGYDVVYACGPMPMMKKVKQICEENDVELYLSLEQRMGCGIGACLVCACAVKTDKGMDYAHVCIDGPVFDSKKVIL